MSSIPEELIDEIRQQTDIVAVIAEYVALTPTGKNYKGLCPFHQEKTPSFTVIPQKHMFYCFGCGAGGNIFTFLMRYEKYTFPEAVETMAKRIGIRISAKTTGQPAQKIERLDALYKLHTEAAEYFKRQLHSEQGKKARAYLEKRGIGDNIIQTFSLGYALSDWEALKKAFIRKYPLEVLLESGLVIKKKDETREKVFQYDRFRDRLMIPIHDERGRIVAFGGRILGEGDPKYLNSPETPIFHKGQVLFGLHHAKDAIRHQEHVIIVEGYFDMIVPYSCGVENIVATMGTAFTDARNDATLEEYRSHFNKLRRYTKKIILLFDPDPAGIRAVHRTLDIFLKSGPDTEDHLLKLFEVRVAILPKGDDPDTAIRRMGVEAFRQYLQQAPLLLDFFIDQYAKNHDLAQRDGQAAFIKEAVAKLSQVNLTERAITINRVVDILKNEDKLHVLDEALLQEFKKALNPGKPRFSQPLPEKQTAFPTLEKYLLKALLKDKSLIPTLYGEFNPQELSHPVVQRIVQELFVYGDKTDFEARILDVFQGTEYQAYLAKLFMQLDEVVDPAATLQDCLARLRQKDFDQATLDSTRKLRDAQKRKDGKEMVETMLAQKNNDLRQKRKFSKKSEFLLEKS